MEDKYAGIDGDGVAGQGLERGLGGGTRVDGVKGNFEAGRDDGGLDHGQWTCLHRNCIVGGGGQDFGGYAWGLVARGLAETKGCVENDVFEVFALGWPLSRAAAEVGKEYGPGFGAVFDGIDKHSDGCGTIGRHVWGRESFLKTEIGEIERVGNRQKKETFGSLEESARLKKASS